MIYLLGGIATFLTVTMFISRQSMLGFPCMIFWGLLGGLEATSYAAVWDIDFFLFFASFGMAIFCALAQFGLHDEERETAYNSTPESEQQKDYLGETVDYDDQQEATGSDSPYNSRRGRRLNRAKTQRP